MKASAWSCRCRCPANSTCFPAVWTVFPSSIAVHATSHWRVCGTRYVKSSPVSRSTGPTFAPTPSSRRAGRTLYPQRHQGREAPQPSYQRIGLRFHPGPASAQRSRTASAMPTAPSAACSSCAFNSSPARSWQKVWRTRRSIVIVLCCRSMKSADLPTNSELRSPTFTRKNLSRRQSWRNAMLASSTHDTKRSEDVRARINVLSEIPAEWYRADPGLAAPERGEESSRSPARTYPVPTKNTSSIRRCSAPGPSSPMDNAGYADFAGRIHTYMEKALREAKVNTSWINPNTEYEAAFHTFLDAILDRSAGKPFLDQFAPFQARIARAGIYNSLSQTLIKIAAPGLPDFYQGTEVWNFSLADPDNRRRVDYDRLQKLLERASRGRVGGSAALVDRLLAEPEDGSLKLYVTRSALRFRREHRALFAKGSYLPLRTAGEKNKHVIAFARSFRGTTVLVLAGRFFAQLEAQTRTPGRRRDLGRCGSRPAQAASHRALSRRVYRKNNLAGSAGWRLRSPGLRSVCASAHRDAGEC